MPSSNAGLVDRSGNLAVQCLTTSVEMVSCATQSKIDAWFQSMLTSRKNSSQTVRPSARLRMGTHAHVLQALMGTKGVLIL